MNNTQKIKQSDQGLMRKEPLSVSIAIGLIIVLFQLLFAIYALTSKKLSVFDLSLSLIAIVIIPYVFWSVFRRKKYGRWLLASWLLLILVLNFFRGGEMEQVVSKYETTEEKLYNQSRLASEIAINAIFGILIYKIAFRNRSKKIQRTSNS